MPGVELGGGGGAIPPEMPRGDKRAAAEAPLKGIKVPVPAAPGKENLAPGRVSKGPAGGSPEVGPVARRALPRGERFFDTYRLRYEALNNNLYSEKKVVISEEDLHNDQANFAYDLVASRSEKPHRLMLAFRYLIGMGTEASEENFLKTIKGKDLKGFSVEGWEDLSKEPHVNYEYYCYLRDFQGGDLFDENPTNPQKSLLCIQALETAAKGGVPAARTLWDGKVGDELRLFRTALEKRISLEKKP
ncbi:MAG: hypothetical protein WCN87_04395 [Chlamydiota bacterium]